jgi:class 3 adenylate cyclase
MCQVLARRNTRLQGAIKAHSGHVFKTGGDGFCAAFAAAPDALAAAVARQLKYNPSKISSRRFDNPALHERPWRRLWGLNCVLNIALYNIRSSAF